MTRSDSFTGKKRLLLISNSISQNGKYLDHCSREIVDFLKPLSTVLFIPYALKDINWYSEMVKNCFEKMGIHLESIHNSQNPQTSVRKATSIFVGGGNTFRLLNFLYKYNLLKIIRNRVTLGTPYIGASAGSNIACPSIKTTNDMPIVYPPSFTALNLVPFNLNPHYLDTDPKSTHKGETREQRIKEFHEENSQKVIGLREGSILRIEGTHLTLKGTTSARLFIKNKKPKEYKPGSRLDFLLK